MLRLKKALQRLMSQTKFDLCFCFFVDSFDEYAGGSQPEIEIAGSSCFKFCVLG